MPSPFHLSCLGEPQLLDGAGEPVRFRTRKHFALLIRLALEPGHTFSRDSLTEFLWPDVPARQARHSLAQAVSVLRAKLGRENLLVRTASVGLRAGAIETDVAQLGADTNGVVRGRFLDGFEVPHSRPFDDWKDQWTAQLIPKVRDALTRHMDAARRIADFATVERHAQLLHDLDPTSEEAVRGLMESRAWVGDRTNALKIFARYEALLEAELSAKPSADLARMAHLLRDGRGAGPRAPEPGQPPAPAHRRFEPEMLIGREREFGALYDAWLDVRRRNPRIMVVLGDPGIGKTTLCNSFAASCQMEGAVVARVQAYDAERELPFAVVSELIRQLVSQRALAGADPEALSELSRIAPEMREAYPGVQSPVQWTPDVMSLRMADAFFKAVTAASEENPLIVIVDDLHAADASSTAILHVAARKLANARLLLVFTARRAELQTTEGPAALVSDRYLKWLEPVELDVLPSSAAGDLVAAHARGAERSGSPPTERILHAASGNPLAIELLTREWVERGPESLLRDLEALNTQPLPSLGIPRAISTMFERLIQRLDRPTRAALDLAAVLGRRLSDVSLYDPVDLKGGQAVEALSRLLDVGLLRDVGGELEFKNELIRAQAYYAVPGPARQHLHRRVAEVLAQRPVDEGHAEKLEIAWHYMRGGVPAKALGHALEGSEAALEGGAPAEAEEILTALLYKPPAGAPISRLRLLLGKALIDQSKGSAAMPVIGDLASDTTLPLRGQAEAALLKATAIFLENADSGDVLSAVTTEALRRTRETKDLRLIAEALFHYVRAATASGEIDRFESASRDIMAILEEQPASDRSTAFFVAGYCDFLHNDLESASSNIRKTLDLLRASPRLAEMARASHGYGVCMLRLLQLPAAYDAFQQALLLYQKIGDDARASGMASEMCLLRTLEGDFKEAIRLGRLGLQIAEGLATIPEAHVLYWNLADAYFLMGDRARAVECLEQGRAWLAARHVRSWRARTDLLLQSAGFALMWGNTDHAIDLIAELEVMVGNRHMALNDPSIFDKLRSLRAAHISGPQIAHDITCAAAKTYQGRNPYCWLNVLAAKAWLERVFLGGYAHDTAEALALFDRAPGKRALLQAQGFLE